MAACACTGCRNGHVQHTALPSSRYPVPKAAVGGQKNCHPSGAMLQL